MSSIISDAASPNRGWTHGVSSAEKSSFTTPAGDVYVARPSLCVIFNMRFRYEVQEVIYKVGRRVERGKITFANGDV
jgi:hypothetical protein